MPSPDSSINAATPLVLSDAIGKIEHIFLALPAYDRDLIDPHLSCFRAIRECLGQDVRCTILCHGVHVRLVTETLAPYGPLDTIHWTDGFVLRLGRATATSAGTTLRVTKMSLPDFTGWVQDSFLVTHVAGKARISASPEVARPDGGWDEEVPRRLAQHLGWPLDILPCALEAGNLLADQQAVVIGRDVRTASAARPWAMLCELLGYPRTRLIVPAPHRRQPVYHLDFFVTLAGPHGPEGRPLALVGSCRLAREALGQPFADAEIEAGLDLVCEDLKANGYLVDRLPLLPPGPQPAWYSYNNCLVEVWTQHGRLRRRVTLPAYQGEQYPGLEALDALAGQAFAALGFDVGFARGEFAELARLGGSVRCMTKVLARCPEK